jgi:type II secretory pathway pseudopilin PulG
VLSTDPTSAGPDAPALPSDRRDGGYSFVEIIVAISLIAIVIAALFQAVITGIQASSRSGYAAQIETTVVNAADRVNRASKRCDYLSVVQNAAIQQKWPTSSVSVSHEYYNAGTWLTGPPSAPACPGSGQEAQLVQRITIRIQSPDGSANREIQVVKSDV